MSWREERTLGKLVKEYGGLIQTGPFGSQLHQHDYVESGIPVVMPKDINSGRVSLEGIAYISESKAQSLNRHILKSPSLVMPRRGDVSKRAFIQEDQAGFFCGTGCIQVVVPQKVLNPRFFYYYLEQHRITDWLQRNAVGTTMLNLSAKIIGEIPVTLIPLGEQERIVDILSAYDDLIENNRRRIQLLEESARLLYREWFVHLRFPGHEHVKIVDGVPEGWEKKTIGEIVVLNYGKSLTAENRIPGNYPVYASSGIVGSHNQALVKGPGIILGRKGNVGSVFWSDDDFYPIDTVYFINTEESSFYLYYSLLNMQFISTDVAVPGLNRNLAYSKNLLIPPRKISGIFEESINPLRNQIVLLEKQNQALVKARDLLLPRLMNGEITV